MKYASVICLFMSSVVPVGIFIPQYAAAQAEIAASIAAGEAMNGVIDNIRNSPTSLIDKVDNSVSSGTFLARMNLQNLASELEFRSKEVVGKTFGELNNSQKVFFSNLRSTVRDAEQLGDRLAENADLIVARGEFLLAMVPGTTREPRLRSHSPRAITDNYISINKQIDLAFDGSFLLHGKPELTLGGKPCTLRRSTDIAVTFTCDISDFSKGDGARGIYRDRIDGTLQLKLEHGFWNFLKGLFNTDVEAKTYAVSLAVVPHVVGTISINAVQEILKATSADRSTPFDSGAQHCVSGSSRMHNISPQGLGWSINTNSIRIQPNSCNRGGAVQENVTANGFQVRAWGNNSGSCGPFGIKDARGWCNGTIYWQETRQDPAPVEVSLPVVEVPWGDQRVIALPDRTKSFVATIRMFDGRVFQFNSDARNEFINVDLNAHGTAVTIAPLPIARAFK